MPQPQQTLNLSPYGHLYDLLIPKDDELRRIHDETDMNFVYTELVKNYCDDNGRTAEDPIRMFRYLLLKVICNLSDAAVVRRANDEQGQNCLLMCEEEDVCQIMVLHLPPPFLFFFPRKKRQKRGKCRFVAHFYTEKHCLSDFCRNFAHSLPLKKQSTTT